MTDLQRLAARQTIETYELALGAALEPLGFKRGNIDGQTIYKKTVKQDFEVVLYAGAYRKHGGVVVDPVLHLDFLPLKQRIETNIAQAGHVTSSSACHFGIQYCSIDKIYEDKWAEGNFIELGASVDNSVKTVVWTLEKYAIPLIMKYTTREALRGLYEDVASHCFHPDIVTLGEELKLVALDEFDHPK